MARRKYKRRRRKGMQRRARKNKVDTSKKYGGIGFLISIPGSLFLAFACIAVAITLVSQYPFNQERWAMFAAGLIAALGLVGSSRIPRTRTFIHELKHAIVVIFTGNKLTGFEVGVHTGQVDYQMAWDRAHLAPLIILAPYFLPIFSLPALVACVILEAQYPLLLPLLLGGCLGADLSFAYSDFHPHQTDLKQVIGGKILSSAFIVCMNVCWCCLCVLWLAGNKNGFVYAGYTIYYFAEDLVARL